MLKKQFKYIAAIMAAALVLSGCAYDISKTLPTQATAVEALATQETTTVPEETTTTTANSKKTTDIGDNNEKTDENGSDRSRNA